VSSTTRVGVVIDALVSMLGADDGPPIQRPNVGDDKLWIGWDGSEQGQDAATGQQDWAGLGNKARNEQLSITCYAQAVRGDDDFKVTRDACLAVVANAETTLRADPTLGGVLPAPGWSWFASLDRLIELRTDDGPLVGAVFTISAFSRL